MTSRLGPRTTRDPLASRVPMAISLCPDSSGATSGSSAFKSVDKSTSIYARTSASLCDQMARSARPRPDCSIRTARTSPNSRARPPAIDQVASVLPLSAIVTRAVNGKPSRRKPTSRRMLGARSCSSLRTGTTMSTCRTLMAMRIGDHLRRWLKRPYARAMSKAASSTGRPYRRVTLNSDEISTIIVFKPICPNGAWDMGYGPAHELPGRDDDPGREPGGPDADPRFDGDRGWRLLPSSPDWPAGEHPGELPEDDPPPDGEDSWAGGIDPEDLALWLDDAR